jgi:hypothetical protein
VDAFGVERDGISKAAPARHVARAIKEGRQLNSTALQHHIASRGGKDRVFRDQMGPGSYRAAVQTVRGNRAAIKASPVGWGREGKIGTAAVERKYAPKKAGLALKRKLTQKPQLAIGAGPKKPALGERPNRPAWG